MLQLLLIAYALFVLVVAVFQRRLIYFPTKLSAEATTREAARAGFVPWRNAAGRIIGWKLPAASASRGSVLVIHGNAGCALDRDYIAAPIHEAAALDVFILEYPGYGTREGSPSEQSLLAAGDDALESLPKNLSIYLVSESLGAGVAAHLAGQHSSEVAGLLMFAPYNRLVSVAQNHLPFLPASLILRDRFDPTSSLKNYRGPVTFVLAAADEIIPAKFGRRLHDEYAGPKNLQVIPGAAHNDIPTQSPEWWREILKFWNQHGEVIRRRP